MNLGDRVRIAGREYIVDDEAFLSANPAEYRSLSWREVDAARLAADGEKWCAVCGSYVAKGGHDAEAHGKDAEERFRADQREAAAADERCETCDAPGPLREGLCSDCAEAQLEGALADDAVDRALEDRFSVRASANAAGRWDWEVRAGEVIVAHGTADTPAGARAAAKTATNWTLDGTPIQNGFDVVGAEDQPDADPCYFCGRRTATSDADPYNGGDGGRICASCVDEHDSILRTAAVGMDDLYEQKGAPTGSDGNEIVRGAEVVVTEPGISDWGGTATSIKWAPSGWRVDVRREEDGLTYSVPAALVRTARTAGKDLVTGGPASDFCVNHNDICAWWAVGQDYYDLEPQVDENGEEYFHADDLYRLMTPEWCGRQKELGGPCRFRRADRFSKRRTAMPSPAEMGVKVGDIFYCSWGYDQTNVNWYEVIRLTGAGVEVQAIRSEIVSSSGVGSDSVVPLPGVPLGRDDVLIRGERKVCRLKDWGGSAGIVLGDYTASLWDGKPKHETSSGYGH